MKRYKAFFESSLNFSNAEEFLKWFNTLQIPKRKPLNISSVEHQAILGFVSILKEPMYKDNISFRNAFIMSKLPQLRLSKEDYENAYKTRDKEPQEVKGKYAIYKHSDVGSYTRFTNNIVETEDILASLKGYHALILKDLTVRFVSAQEMKSAAKWVSSEKSMWINPLSTKVGNTKEEYGSLKYIVVHELGHKFLDEYPQKWNISDPLLYTTPYSKRNIETLTEEEVFAELFALSNWKEKYPQYKKQIEEFEKRLEY